MHAYIRTHIYVSRALGFMRVKTETKTDAQTYTQTYTQTHTQTYTQI